MHLESCPPVVHSELRRGIQPGSILRSCRGNRGNSGGNLPLGTLSNNTADLGFISGVASLQLTAPPISTLKLLPQVSHHASEDVGAQLDIWSVIKSGHVREKIAIFAAEGRQTEGQDGECSSSVSRDRKPSQQIHAPMAMVMRGVKTKGSWEEKCNAKRRRRSGNSSNHQQQLALTVSPRQSEAEPLACMQCPHEQEGEEPKVSVGEMVAFLEQRASEQQPEAKPAPLLQRSSASITLSRAPPPELPGEEPEFVKVSDMVARLECLRRTNAGDLSRSNSLRRTVGRVLLAAADQSPAPCLPLTLTSPVTSSSFSAMPEVKPAIREPISSTGSVMTFSLPSSHGQTTPPPGEPAVAPPLNQTTPPNVEAEPLPGLLFFSSAASEMLPPSNSVPPLPYLETRPPAAVPDFSSQSESRRKRTADVCSATLPVGRRVSQHFLFMRQRLQQLLAPPPCLCVLPHHLLVKIFVMLPTRSLAALKTTCHYFRFLIDMYGVRPADSLWVSDPRYRDDPCKQCKKRYVRGDVSLCRWHHKPFCRSLPHGPGFWMCCHGNRRDTPGCNVGLHDNCWVPAFHKIKAPIYRRSCHDD